MAQMTDNFQAVITGLSDAMKANGFKQVPAKDGDSDQSGATVYFAGEKGALRVDLADGKISLFGTNVAFDAAQDGDYKRLTSSLLDDGTSDSDVKYVAADFSETITDKFGTKTKAIAKSGVKNVQTVSKAAVKSGVAYDAITLANKLTLVFPELRGPYRDNIDSYGEFLAEDFFVNYGTPVIVEAIRHNNPTVMKKLFNILNDIYEDGSNDVQSLIAVTILGQLGNDKILLANCVDYMCESMAPSVIEVNRFLATGAGKRASKKLANPPAYKPKKEKKPGFMQRLMGGGQQQGGIGQ